MREYTARCGKQQFKQSLQTLLRAARDDGNTGFCLACGSEEHEIEPDARRVRCEACGMLKVYGAEELLVMKLYHE